MASILFYGVRHGRTQGNEDGRYRGWSNKEFAQLAPEGKNDIMEAALFFKKQGITFPIVLSDDTDRAKESLQILAKILDISETEIDKRLRPLNVGDFTGKPKDEYPLDDYFKNPKKKIPGGESTGEFDRRIAKIMADILELVATLKEPVLVILHGSTISFLHTTINKEQVGYEGLVEPGGVVSVSAKEVLPLLKKSARQADRPEKKSSSSGSQSKESYALPGKDNLAIRVPKGGSMCKNCKYLDRNTMKDCKQKDFIAFNGSSLIPAPINEFCSVWYEPEVKQPELEPQT